MTAGSHVVVRIKTFRTFKMGNIQYLVLFGKSFNYFQELTWVQKMKFWFFNYVLSVSISVRIMLTHTPVVPAIQEAEALEHLAQGFEISLGKIMRHHLKKKEKEKILCTLYSVFSQQHLEKLIQYYSQDTDTDTAKMQHSSIITKVPLCFPFYSHIHLLFYRLGNRLSHLSRVTLDLKCIFLIPKFGLLIYYFYCLSRSLTSRLLNELNSICFQHFQNHYYFK